MRISAAVIATATTEVVNVRFWHKADVEIALTDDQLAVTGGVVIHRKGFPVWQHHHGDAGWVEGRNVQIEYRYAGTDRDTIEKHVAELIRLAPDVIVANSAPVMALLRPATNTIPIVFVVVNDPVGQGFIPNLAHPGSNVTGFSFIEPEIVGKWINLLGDVRPDLSRVALMFNPDTAAYYYAFLRSFKALAQQSRVEVDAAPVRSAADVERAVAELGGDQHAGLIVARIFTSLLCAS